MRRDQPPVGRFEGDVPALFKVQRSGPDVVPLVEGRSYLVSSPPLFAQLLRTSAELGKPEMARWRRILDRVPQPGAIILGSASPSAGEGRTLDVLARSAVEAVAGRMEAPARDKLELLPFWRASIVSLFLRSFVGPELDVADAAPMALLEKRDRMRSAMTRRYWFDGSQGLPTEAETNDLRERELAIRHEQMAWIADMAAKTHNPPPYDEEDLEALVAMLGAMTPLVTILVAATAMITVDDRCDRAWWERLFLDYSPTWIVGRNSARAMEVGGVTIEAGSQLLFSPLAAAYDPRCARLTIGSAHIFGTGPRRCPATAWSLRLAQALLSAFDQTLPRPAGVDGLVFDTAVSLMPQPGAKIGF